MHRIGNGPFKILFAAAIHGNEVGTIKLAHHLLEWLPCQTAHLERFSFFVIPCLNPDGTAQALETPDYLGGGRVGRFNGNGVDLNRNFPTSSFQSTSDWTHGKNYTERTPVFCGSNGASEPEMHALTEWMKKEKINLWVMFHNAGADVMGNDHPLVQKLAPRYAQQAVYKFQTLDEWQALRQTGTAKEWCDGNGIPYLEIEGSSRWASDWKRQKPAIEDLLNALS